MKAKQRTGRGVWHWKHVRPNDPTLKPRHAWLPANQGFYAAFRKWLTDASYGESALNLYSVAARLALGVLDKPYWLIDPDADLARMRQYLVDHFASAGTRSTYGKGLAKFEEYVRATCQRPPRERTVRWSCYLEGLRTGLGQDVQRYVAQRRRT
jgi:hypothetical protein